MEEGEFSEASLWLSLFLSFSGAQYDDERCALTERRGGKPLWGMKADFPVLLVIFSWTTYYI